MPTKLPSPSKLFCDWDTVVQELSTRVDVPLNYLRKVIMDSVVSQMQDLVEGPIVIALMLLVMKLSCSRGLSRISMAKISQS